MPRSLPCVRGVRLPILHSTMELRTASALITGAGRGIGRAVALALAREGAQVTLVSRTASELERLAAEVQAAGGRPRVFQGDIRSAPVCEAAVTAAVDFAGGLGILINNAGVGIHASLAETSDDDFARMLETNLVAPFRLTRAALPHLTRTGGHVVMISSLAGVNPIAGLSVYCATKAALDQLAASLMLEVRQHGVKVTTVAPGSVDTSFSGSPKGDTSWMLTADDVAEVVMNLLRARDGAHPSRVELRPARPQKRG
jgi:3-oxoacyl-[acyl-carrier protein] reductase